MLEVVGGRMPGVIDGRMLEAVDGGMLEVVSGGVTGFCRELTCAISTAS